jgi:pimeloyl-ACP methyl ester carboxylesterase
MPMVSRPDGVELNAYAVGEGPPVVIAPYLMGMPDGVAPFVAEMSRDHTVIRFDGRGTGESTRVGPFDMKTGADDLEAVVEALCDGPAVVIGIADSANRAVRVAAARPELIAAVISPGTAPIHRQALEGIDAMAGSDTVVGALLENLGSYYASAVRTLVDSANPQMSEDELRERVEGVIDYLPQETAVGRLQNWIGDDAEEEARAIGGKLIVLTSENVVQPWWPSEEDVLRLIAERLPEARVEHIDDGLVTRPDQTAAIVREVTGGLRAAAATEAAG